MESPYLTTVEVAALLRRSRMTITNWLRQGSLPGIRVGRHWLIHRDDVARLLQAKQ